MSPLSSLTPGLLPVETEDELPYHRLLRAGGDERSGARWPRRLLGVVAMLAAFWAVGPLLVGLVVQLVVAATGGDVATRMAELSDTGEVTPGVLLYVCLSLAVAIPASWLVLRLVDGLPPRWLASVGPRIRWSWLLVSFGPALAALLVAVALGTALPTSEASAAATGDAGGALNDVTSTTVQFLVVIVCLTPLQAAAEEYVFRGYLTQAFGGILDDRRAAAAVAVAVPALVFALLHGSQSPAVFFDRLAFGVAAGVLVIATGGLEATIAYHVMNNVLAFGLALFFGDISEVLTPTGGSWWDVLVSTLKSVLFVALALVAARRLGVRTTAHRSELVASSARV